MLAHPADSHEAPAARVREVRELRCGASVAHVSASGLDPHGLAPERRASS
jgi:hypothetical protein